MSDEKKEETIQEWAARATGKTVLHVPTLRVAEITKFYEPGTYKSPLSTDEAPDFVQEPVVELASGDSFVAKPKLFVILNAAEVILFKNFVQGLTGLVAIATKGAASMGVGMDETMTLIASGLRAQLDAIGASSEDPR